MAVLEKRLADPFSDGASAVLNASDAVDPVDRRTLLGVLESSYTLLSEPEKALLRQVSVFAAGWTLDSAEAVCLAPASGGANLLALLAQLVRRSLVVHSEKDGVVRYRLSRLVALFARRRLVDAGEEVDAARRYRDYFAGLAQRASAELDGELAGDWLDFLEEERGNLSAALAGFADDPEGTEPGIAMAVALYRFWTIRGHAGEGQAVLLRLLNRTGVRRTAAGARGLTALGSLSWERGRLAEARSLFQEALAVRTDLGDLLGVADVDNNLGNIAWEEGRFDEAQALFESSMATLESLNDEAGLAAVCGNLAALCCDIGDLDRAETLFERALRIDRARQDSWGIATSLDGIAVAARKRGEIHRAVMLRVEALRLRRQIQDRAGIVESLEGLVALLADRGEASDAAVLIGAADRQRELLESPLPPRRRLERRALVEALRDATAENYDECRRRGYEMTWQEVVDFAIVMDR